MNYDDATLMAYVDGELDAATRAAIAAACATDASLSERIAAQRLLRRRVAGAYAPVADEPVPERLASLLVRPTAPVAELSAARNRQNWRATMGHWRTWGAMAACLLLGVWLGRGWRADEGAWVQAEQGRLRARGALASALDGTRSGPAAPGSVAISMSFVARDGRYCRSFGAEPVAGLAGLACRDAEGWRIELLTGPTAAPEPAELRMAATPLPEPLLRQIDALIDGSPLDAAAERAAIERNWQPLAQQQR